MKKTSLFIFTLLVAASLISCNKKNPIEEPITLVFAEVNPEASICGQMDAAFKQKVEELSKGLIQVDVKYSGVIGDETQVMEMILQDNTTVQLARVSANLSSYGGKKSKLISTPYTFSNPSHFWKFSKSELAQDILIEPYELGLGVRGLCYAEEGFRNFFSIEPLNSVEDFEDKTMRVSGKILTDLANALKSEPLKIPFTDLYMSLQTGAVEIADQPITNYLTNSLYKVAPNMVMDGHMLGAVQILISSKTWDSLSEKQQKIIKEAADYASDYCRTISDNQEREAIEKLTAEGVNLIEVKDIEPFQKACKEMISENTKEFPELYQEILKLAD